MGGAMGAAGEQSWLSKALLPTAVPCPPSRAGAASGRFSVLLPPPALGQPGSGGAIFKKPCPTPWCCEPCYAKPVLGRAGSRCWEQAAAAHVEGWPSHLGSLSLERLGGTAGFLRSPRLVAGCLRALRERCGAAGILKKRTAYVFF